MDSSKLNSRELLGASARIPAHVVYREFPAEVVLLNLDTGQYHGLNPTAGLMLQALAERGDVADAVQQLVTDLGQPRQRIEDDLIQLVLGLEERGLLVVDRPDTGQED